MKPEKWKIVPDYDNCYEASSLGRIRNSHTAEIAHQSNCEGYLQVMIKSRFNSNTKIKQWRAIGVHVLVAKAFLGPYPTPKHEVNHKDLDKSNNHYKNLEYLTHQENIKHAVRKGVCMSPHPQKGEDRYNSVLTEHIVRKIRKLYATGNYTQKELGKMFGANRITILDVVNNKTWKHI